MLVLLEWTGKLCKGSRCGWGDDVQLVSSALYAGLCCRSGGECLDGRDLGALLNPSYSLAVQ